MLAGGPAAQTAGPAATPRPRRGPFPRVAGFPPVLPPGEEELPMPSLTMPMSPPPWVALAVVLMASHIAIEATAPAMRQE